MPTESIEKSAEILQEKKICESCDEEFRAARRSANAGVSQLN
jgi:hypothetical protein